MVFPPSLSVVIEWDNARISELERTRRMLRELASQLRHLRDRFDRPVEVLFLHDVAQVERAVISATLEAAFDVPPDLATVAIHATDGLGYYELKNYGADSSAAEILLFLDSDVIPEPGWLERLLSSFERDDVGVVCGNTYVDPEGLYAKAFALFWFFPLRRPDGRLVPASQFFANNVAFRRSVFRPFPPSRQFRGQCVALARTLRFEDRVRIYRQEAAQVSHPPPNGFGHFFNRALCEGHDNLLAFESLAGRPVGGLKFYLRRLRGNLADAFGRIRTNRRSVALGPGGAALAAGLAVVYYGLVFVGELLSARDPVLIERNFPV